MKTALFLPLLTYPDASSEMMIGNAVEFARNLDALLHAVVVDITIPPLNSPWSSLLIDTDKMVREAESTSRGNGEHLLNVLMRRCAVAEVALETETICAYQPTSDDEIVKISRHYDFALLEAAAHFRSISEAVIFGSGRPVLLYPDLAFSGRIEHVAIAWDGSRAAARALGDATPFIDAASKISIISALDEKPVADDLSQRVVDRLRARGLNVEAHAIHTHQQPIGDALQLKAIELRADLLVMGAFGHSRLREFILGGATADVLANPRLPTFMSN